MWDGRFFLINNKLFKVKQNKNTKMFKKKDSEIREVLYY